MQLDIESLAYGGDSIGHLPDGRTAFVRGGCPGDRVEAHVVREHQRYVNLAVDEIVSASPHRVTPPCPYFGVCGGCQWQHIAYETQLEAKRQAVVDALSRIGGMDSEPLVAQCVASPLQYGYRNKIELIAEERNGQLQLGFSRLGENTLVPIDTCLLLPKRAAKAPKAVTGALRYVLRGQACDVERVALRVAHNTGDLEVAVWTEPGPFPRKLAAKALSDAVKATSVVRVLAKGETAARKVVGTEVLKGKGAWRERMSGISFLISAPSFFQVNTPAAEILVRIVTDALAAKADDAVLDLYSGAGTFTLPIAQQAGEIVAVESYGPAVSDLRRNVDNAASPVEIAPGDAAYVVPELGEFDLVVVDPPRAGLAAEMADTLVTTAARRIVYVSCDPSTLARDTKLLAERGYMLSSATPVDLFPQTYHVETVAVFDRAD